MDLKFQVSSYRLNAACGAGWMLCFTALAGDFSSLCADREAVERIYYNHRLGEKPPFEQTLPRATRENLVRQDLRKEAILKRAYGVEITDSLLGAEVQRINSHTRAPDMLAEIKSALGDDPTRFANVFAKPILVERLLREKFDNDDALHAPQRHEMERVRTQLTNAAAKFRNSSGREALTEKSGIRSPKSDVDQSFLASADRKDLAEELLALLKHTRSNSVTEVTWQLRARPAETNAPSRELLEVQKRFGPKAQILSSPDPSEGKERQFYFDELPDELQKVLRIQLRQPGDVSAVIEMPGGFLLYLATEKTADTLSLATLSIPKRSYEQWLNEQSESKS